MRGDQLLKIRDENLRLLYAQQSSDWLAQRLVRCFRALRRTGWTAFGTSAAALAILASRWFLFAFGDQIWLPPAFGYVYAWTSLLLPYVLPVILLVCLGYTGLLLLRRRRLRAMQADLENLLRKYNRGGTLKPWPRPPEPAGSTAS